MTVTGATTASLATQSYTPPFKYVTSYAPQASITGTVTSAVANTPTVSAGTSDSDYAWAYLQQHMMSSPSYRYAYLLWMVLALIAIVYAIAHHVRLSGGSMGAAYSSWGMKRVTLGSKKPGRRARAWPSNSVLVAAGIIAIVTAVLCVVGADYIIPSSSVLDFSSSFKRSVRPSYARRVVEAMKRANSSPYYTITKSFWTSGSRFGDIAFALMPLVVLFALKAPPVAVLSIKWFSHLFADKLASFHRLSAWIVWIATTVHVVLWTIQLFQDSYNGKKVWVVMWTNYRFIAGSVAYLALTLVMALSIRPIRKNRYEFFYIAHVISVLVTIAACAVHHPVLWYWMAAAGGLWAAERAVRVMRFARINGFSRRRAGHPNLVAGKPYRDTTLGADGSYGMADIKQPAKYSYDTPYADKTLPKVPQSEIPGSRSDTPLNYSGSREFGAGGAGYYDEGSLQPLGSYESRVAQYGGDTYSRDGRSTPASSTAVSHGGYFPVNAHERQKSEASMYDTADRRSIPTLPVAGQPESGPLVAPPIPVGYAQAQLLPSRTLRLTIRTAHPLRWAPGQSVLLYLPELSRFQSHPFTILNNDPSEIVLLVKARKGLTRQLFDLVRRKSLANMGLSGMPDKRLSLASMQTGNQGSVTVPPVHVRAMVDGPMGSAGRVRWGDFSSVVIICGGSGVSFGVAICDYLSNVISGRHGRGFKTQRVRFCWVAREYAEIAWVAHQLHRCREALSAAQLQIDIFVTNASKARDDFALPTPGFARGGPGAGRRGSTDSVTSQMSVDIPYEDEETVEGMSSMTYADVVDLTNYEDEEDVNDPAENQLSDRLQHQGKVRRAKSRKAASRANARQARGSGSGPTASYPPQRRSGPRFSMHDGEESSSELAYAAAAGGQAGRGSQYEPPASSPLRTSDYSTTTSPTYGHAQLPHSQSFSHSQPLAAAAGPGGFDRRQSFQSLAPSTYDRYDPYAGTRGVAGPSPSPSMFFDDGQSIAGESVRNLLKTSRSQSMVLLEDNGQDPNGDAALWIDEADYTAMNAMAEFARPGKPKLATVLEEEIEQAQGRMIVATCGPTTLNTVVRNLVASHISPARIRHGDKRGHIAIYSEDYES